MSKRRANETLKKIASSWLIYGALALFLTILGAVIVLTINSAQQRLFGSGRLTRESRGLIRLDTQSCRFLLSLGLPVLEQTAVEDDPFRLFEFDWSGIYWRLAANIRRTESREIMKAQFPLLALVKIAPPKPPVIKNPRPVKPPPVQNESLSSQLAYEPQILIYHTHTSESYIPASGKDHLLNQRGDIVKVGARLQKVLETKYHIKTLHCDTIHDQPPFKESYERSQLTVKQYLRNYPSLKLLIDLHRDATPGLNAVCSIKGVKTATILAVVGTDKMMPHPNWRQNRAFATQVMDRINLYYPGLSNGVIVSKGRYNQHLHPRALIFEVGDQYSTLKEAYHAVDNFAAILALTLKEE